MIKKLSNKKGESLIEALTSVLVIAISAAILVTMVVAAVSINQLTNNAATSFYENLSETEIAGTSGVPGFITVNGEELEVIFYGEEGDLIAYR